MSEEEAREETGEKKKMGRPSRSLRESTIYTNANTFGRRVIEYMIRQGEVSFKNLERATGITKAQRQQLFSTKMRATHTWYNVQSVVRIAVYLRASAIELLALYLESFPLVLEGGEDDGLDEVQFTTYLNMMYLYGKLTPDYQHVLEQVAQTLYVEQERMGKLTDATLVDTPQEE